MINATFTSPVTRLCVVFLSLLALAQPLRAGSADAKAMKEALIEEPAPSWINVQLGYSSKYMFRGTDLTPNSEGIIFAEASLTGPGFTSAGSFTIGVWAAHQLGEAVVVDATGFGEAGGGGGNSSFGGFDEGFPGLFLRDTAIQSTFTEYDFYLQYAHSFGWIDLTFGNIAFIVERTQVDRFEARLFGETLFVNGAEFIDFKSIGDEVYSRLFLSVSSSKLRYVTPSITYYQTIYNEGDGGASEDTNVSNNPLFFERNMSKGGYLEAKVTGEIPVYRDIITVNPTALISYSFDDRSEAKDFVAFESFSSEPFTGFHHTQFGAELVWNATKNIRISGFGNYAYRFSEPTAGTDENTFWGGGKVSVSF